MQQYHTYNLVKLNSTHACRINHVCVYPGYKVQAKLPETEMITILYHSIYQVK